MSEQKVEKGQTPEVAQVTDSNDNTSTENTQAPRLSAGKVLSQARQQKNIKLADLAEQIRVPLNVLEAIEIDKVPKNLPDTFIRGYIRSYAKKVGVDESLVLPEVETLAATTEAPKKMQSFSRRNHRKTREKRLVLISWFMLFVLLIAVIIWWLQDSEKSEFAPVATTSQMEMAEQVAQPLEAMPMAESSSVEQSTEVKAMPTLTSETSAVPASEAESQETQSDVTANSPLTLTPEQKAVVADNGEPDEAGFLKVEMRFENECWVEVYDVTGDRVAVGNKPDGYLMTLNAQGPLNVLLGNPVGVSIWVNGKPFDTSDLPKNRVARFELEAI